MCTDNTYNNVCGISIDTLQVTYQYPPNAPLVIHHESRRTTGPGDVPQTFMARIMTYIFRYTQPHGTLSHSVLVFGL